MTALFSIKVNVFNILSPKSFTQMQDVLCWCLFFYTKKLMPLFTAYESHKRAKCSVFWGVFFVSFSGTAEALGSWGLLQLSERKLSSMWCSWVASRAPWETEQLLWISFWEIGYLYRFAGLLVCLNISWLQSWMSHVSLPCINLLLHRCSIPISPTIASGS